jgi:cytoskeletal protein CcmA (bactofilin family)
MGAIVTNGDLEITGSVDVSGPDPFGSIHSNGDLDISGVGTSVSGDITASGTYTGALAGSSGEPEIEIPTIRAADYRHYADFVLSDAGIIETLDGTLICDSGPAGNSCRPAWGWAFNGAAGWSMGAAGTPANGTFYIEGAVEIGAVPGAITLTLIAEGSIEISGSPDLSPDTPELLLVTDGDLDISGGVALDPLTIGGQMLVHEQVSISGNPTLAGQLIVEDSPSMDPLVDVNQISGNVTIVYNGGLGSAIYSLTGWREVRE